MNIHCKDGNVKRILPIVVSCSVCADYSCWSSDASNHNCVMEELVIVGRDTHRLFPRVIGFFAPTHSLFIDDPDAEKEERLAAAEAFMPTKDKAESRCGACMQRVGSRGAPRTT